MTISRRTIVFLSNRRMSEAGQIVIVAFSLNIERETRYLNSVWSGTLRWDVDNWSLSSKEVFPRRLLIRRILV